MCSVRMVRDLLNSLIPQPHLTLFLLLRSNFNPNKLFTLTLDATFKLPRTRRPFCMQIIPTDLDIHNKCLY